MTRFNVSFDGIMDRLEELERENHRLIAERDARHQQVIWRNARIDELQTMIDAMRPMVEAVAAGAEYASDLGDVFHCLWCDGEDVEQRDVQHDNNCFVTQARAFVATHPTAGKAESEGE